VVNQYTRLVNLKGLVSCDRYRELSAELEAELYKSIASEPFETWILISKILDNDVYVAPNAS
jgi:hypothetical protein